jgi:polar amino acid transport system substrate-binding protein
LPGADFRPRAGFRRGALRVAALRLVAALCRVAVLAIAKSLFRYRSSVKMAAEATWFRFRRDSFGAAAAVCFHVAPGSTFRHEPAKRSGKQKYRDPMPSRTTSCRLGRSAKARALRFFASLVCALAAAAPGGYPAAAAESAAPAPAPAPGLVVPGFWDPRRRPERPDLSRIQTIRFLTEADYPPFDYSGPDGNPAGFNVDLARLICDEIKVSCTIQARNFGGLFDALNDNRGDAVIASIAPTAEARQRADFTDPYYRTPARFVARLDSPVNDVLPERLERKKIAVIAGTAHEAYLKAMFTEAEVRAYPNADTARTALRNKDVDLLFGDGISLAFWLNGSDSGGCCVFRGGPFLESRFFGEGIGIAVKRGNDLLRQAFNWALFRLWERGSFTDLWLRYFPINPF